MASARGRRSGSSLALLSVLTGSLLATLGTAAKTSDLGPVVDLGYAAYAGNATSPAGLEDGPVVFYGGIPFAQPPVGELRWRAPQLLDESGNTTADTDVVDARNWSTPCVQFPLVDGVGSEDCLTLNVWKPANASEGDDLSVAVYIHGGGLRVLSPLGFPLYDWVDQQPNVVGVSIAYRLGFLGFFSGGPDTDDNVGFLDQRAALEWVQRHISKFGGNPEDVTIYGESAGGASVIAQMAAYGGTKPVPFQRAVAQSIGFEPARTMDDMKAAFTNLTTQFDCPETGIEATQCLRNLKLSEFAPIINSTNTRVYDPVVEDEGPDAFQPDLPSRLIASGRFNTSVDFIGGHTSGDGKTFASAPPESFVTDEDIKTRLFARWPLVTNETKEKALELYPSPDTPGSPFATQWDRAWTMAGEIEFSCMDWFVASTVANLTDGQSKTYSYVWDSPDPVLLEAKPYLGAMHTSDLYFLFAGTNTLPNAGNSFTPFNSTEAVLSEEAIAYWTSFAIHGDPSVSKLSAAAAWDSLVAADGNYRLVLRQGDESVANNTMERISEDEIERCQFWMSEEVTSQTRI